MPSLSSCLQASLPLIPCHPLLLIIRHPSLLFHAIPSSFDYPSSLFSVTPPYTVLTLFFIFHHLSLYPISSLLLHEPFSLPFISCHLLFIPHHPSPLSHIIPPLHPTSSFTLFHVIPCLCPIILFIPCHLLFFISLHPFSFSCNSLLLFIPYPFSFLYCHLLVFISYQPLPFVALLYLIFPFRSPLRASQLTPKILREKTHCTP